MRFGLIFCQFLFRGVRSKTLSRLHEDIARCQEDLTAAFTLETRFIAQQIVEIYAQGGQAVLDKVAAVKRMFWLPTSSFISNLNGQF